MKRKPLSVPHSLGGTLRTALASLPVFILFIFLPLLSPFPLSLSRIPSLFYFLSFLSFPFHLSCLSFPPFLRLFCSALSFSVPFPPPPLISSPFLPFYLFTSLPPFSYILPSSTSSYFLLMSAPSVTLG